MRGFLGLTKRNLLIYFKDIHAVIFSLLTSIIVFVLYLVFLKGNYVSAFERMSVGLESFITTSDMEILVSGILLVGIIGSALVTVPFNCLTTIIKDRENKIDYDISATPIKRWQIILAYFCASVISAFLVTSLILAVGLSIISNIGDINMTASDVAFSFFIILLGSLSSTALFLIICLFFKSSSASSAFFGMLSAASGFIIGAYIPLSEFSENVQTVCNLFPATQITVLLRNNLLTGILETLDSKIGGVDGGAFVVAVKDAFNFKAFLLGNSLDQHQMYLYIAITFALSIAIMIFIYNKTYKRK